jgi:hypothetical protein
VHKELLAYQQRLFGLVHFLNDFLLLFVFQLLFADLLVLFVLQLLVGNLVPLFVKSLL